MKERDLINLLDMMELPIQRKGTVNKNNLLWLQKNLKKMNSDHSKYHIVMKEIERRIEEKDYDN